MTISELFIRKPIMTTLVMVVVVCFGIAAYFSLPVSSLPNVDYPVIQITATYPGASPATMASTVATPLENECMQINGIEQLISDNTEGSTTITLTFSLDRNVDLVAPDVQAAISRAQNNLPPDLPTPPSYKKNNPSDKPIMYLAVTTDTLTPGELYDYANRMIAKQISIIEGVSQVQIYGAKTAIRVQADPAKLAARGIGLDQIASVLNNGTANIPGGSLNGDYRTFSVEPQGQLYEGDAYGELIVAYRDGAPVRLKDVAHCKTGLNDEVVDIQYVVFNPPRVSDQAICMAISKQAGANTVALAKRLRREIEATSRSLPGAVQVEIMYDGSKPIEESINDVQQTILIAVALVVMIIFLFLGRLRETTIPSLVIPIALVGTFIVMAANAFSLDTLSLMALVLSVGFLVDDAIVVLENTVRHVEEGEPPIQAAIHSMKELTGTVISTSVALVIVFVPLVFMAGVVGKNFREFALTAIFAIAVSTVLALTLTPVMCSRMLKPTGSSKTAVQRIIDGFIGGLIDRYGRALTWTLKRRWLSVLAWAGCIAGAGFLFTILPKTFIPPGDSGMLMGVMMMPQGASTDQMKAYQEKVTAFLLRETNLVNAVTVTGVAEGADQSTGYLFLSLKPPNERPPIDQVNQKIMGELFALPDGMVFLSPIPVLKLSTGGEATAAGSKYSYTLRGSDRDEVYATAGKLQQRMATIPGIVGVQTSVKLTMPQLEVDIDRDRASTLGLDVGSIERALSMSFAHGRITTFTTDSDQYDVVLELSTNAQRRVGDLSLIYLRPSNGGDLVPLGSVARWTPTVGPQNVPHSQQMDAATLSFNIADGVPLGDVTKALDAAAAEILPPSVVGLFQGEAQEFEEAMKSLAVMLGISVFLMYIVLGILYESYIHPFTVLTTLPVGAFGGVLTLWLFGSELSLYAYIGLFTLLGIIAKNGIMMVDFAIQHYEENPDSTGVEAIHNACMIRFRPILMTGMSTIFGTLPMAMGYGADGSSRIPLGLIVVGGMVFAQVVTLFVTPGIFLYMDGLRRFFERRAQRQGGEKAATVVG